MKRHYIRGLYYLAGLFIMTAGIALTIQSSLGTSPFDALLVGLHRTFGLTIGSWEIVVGLTMILFNAAASRKKPELFAVITSLMTGAGIDFWVFILRETVQPETAAVPVYLPDQRHDHCRLWYCDESSGGFRSESL